MPEAVLDASALIALLRKEPGADVVASLIRSSCISTVNYSETLAKMVDRGYSLEQAAYQIDRLQLPVIPFDVEQSKVAASLRASTRQTGLSLGDRACLALGVALQKPVVTTDRAWSGLELGIAVQVIR